MKWHSYIMILSALFLAAIPLMAQEENNQQQRSPRLSRGERTIKQDDNVSQLSVRSQEFNERMTQELENARWMRVIYREIDLTKEENAPLYYPLRPMNGQNNLFTIIFRLLGENRIQAYEYLDGYEVFDNEHAVNFKEMLDRYHIFYEETEQRRGEEPALVIDDSDIPSEEVRAFYIKEAWYLDQNNSVFDVKTLAICPILFYNGDMGETRMPMFWLPYETIRPYINTTYIMTSNINNATTFTIDDYFRRRMFKGDIIKTQNLLNRPLQAYCPTPDSLDSERQRIEKELAAFEKSIWIQPDTAQITGEEEKKEKQLSARSKNKNTGKEQKVKASKNSSATTTKSVRSIRRR